MQFEEFSSLVAIGYDDTRHTELASLDEHLVPGRVTRVDRGAVTVLTNDGDVRVAVAPEDDIAVGDWVALDLEGQCRGILERRGSVRRLVGNRHDTMQIVAANVDLTLLVRPLDLSLSPQRIQAMLTLGYDSGTLPVVLLTKADLADDVTDFVEEIESIAPGVEVVPVSVVTGEGVDRVRALVANRTVVFLGESGGGKSTLTNLLAGEEVLAVGETRSDGQGRHTTSHRQLVPLPSGGAIIDTPGVREVVAAITRDGVDEGFAEITVLTGACRFADCSHHAEPGCAVQAAITDGRLDQRRFAAYEAAMRDVERNERRADPSALKAAQSAMRKQHRTFERQRRRDSW